MRFEVSVKYKEYRLKRFVTFTGDREGYFEDEEGKKTCEFKFETFSNVYLRSHNGQEYFTSELPTDHPIREAVSAIHGAYIARRQWQWAQEGKKTA